MKNSKLKAGLIVRGLSVDFHTDDGVVNAVKNVDFHIAPGRRVGFVGESGSGKTTTALALMGMIEPPGIVKSGTGVLDGVNLLELTESELQQERLKTISYIPQGAMNSLNPVARIETQILDGLWDHGRPIKGSEAKDFVADILTRVGLSPDVARSYPHELSGGMKQRVCIAISIAMSPKLIIADEPTSALDVITQRRVMETLARVQDEIGSSLILIGHDMGLMAQFVDELMVMRNGEVVEKGAVKQVFKDPKHTYTKTLIDSVPSLKRKKAKKARPIKSKPRDTPLLQFNGVQKVYGQGIGAVQAVAPLNFTLHGDIPRIIAIVGQSGSGKTTLGSLALGFETASNGHVFVDGKDIATLNKVEAHEFRKEVQAVFQDPYASFNPFYRVDHALTVPLKNFGVATSKSEQIKIMVSACESVNLDPGQTIHRYAHEMSGGQRQRLMVGRSIMLEPKLLIADEPVSMVDASLRSSILRNLSQMKNRLGTSVLYITHDLATAYEISDYVLVMHRGHVVEAGTPSEVIDDPQHPYTRLLVNSIPWPDPDLSWGGGSSIDDEVAIIEGINSGDNAIIRSQIDGFTIGDQKPTN